MRFIDANYIEYQPTKWLTYDDVMLVPQHSRLNSRNDPQINLSTPLTSVSSMSLPIISANMDTITEADMAIAMGKAGGYGILHRFYRTKHENPMDAFLADIRKIHAAGIVPAFSVGLNPEDFKAIDAVLGITGKAIVCVDVAHGDQDQVFKHIRKIALAYPNLVEIIGGNVATPAGVETLVRAGCHGIKCGVGGGAVCSTRIITGHGVPNLSTIMQCRRALMGLQSNAALIADGGIRTAGDIVKALAAGANSVMVGRLLAGTDECPGMRYKKMRGLNDHYIAYDPEQRLVGYENAFYAKYRGQSSKEFNEELGKEVAAEGVSTYVECQGPMTPILQELVGGIRSGLTYSGAKNLTDLHNRATFLEVSHAGLVESHPHGA